MRNDEQSTAEDHREDLTPDQIRRAPKVLLRRPSRRRAASRHGRRTRPARPATRHSPRPTPTRLGAWFHQAADSGSLSVTPETFRTPSALMQTRDALVRVAAECAEDPPRTASSTPRCGTPPSST
ncbi:hypothetical protein LV779_21565 [Streptomyces thinghirensis]|nr:hypothetical protein [Streptomyces thinghirensis]